jgi:hypothetical protein
MAIEKSIGQVQDAQSFDIPPEESDEIVVTIDGEVYDGDAPAETVEVGFSDNLAEYLTESQLQEIASNVISDYDSDVTSRRAWIESYLKGLDLLGVNIEEKTEPWAGAAGMYHPVLAEAVVRFQAESITETFPASGPARTKVVGKKTPEVMAQAVRVETELNYLMTDKMPECRDEHEQMLFMLPLAGSGFKKIYYDDLDDRPVSLFVGAEDLVVPYGASNLRTAPRYTHRMRHTPNEMRQLQVSGFYRDIEMSEPQSTEDDVEAKYAKLEGQEKSFSTDDRHTTLEMHVDMDLPGEFADPDGIHLPYIVTVDKGTSTVLAIRRNWSEADPKRRKRIHFAHYKYIPGTGFYGFGLIHLIGGLAKSATSILRQLVDAGSLQNLPAGFKSRGLRVKGNSTPLGPGEFRDVDVPSERIQDSLYVMQFNGPSGTLFELMTNLVQEARRLGSIADADIGSMRQDAPVGTTLAILERSLKVMSAVQARLHAAMKTELRLISKIVSENMDGNYEYDADGEFNRKNDFDGRVDIIPVSDPNASTMSQRVVQHQAALAAAAQAPQYYNQALLHRKLMEALGIDDPDKIVALPEEVVPADPVAENMGILNQKPVKAFLYQDHMAHIRVHKAAAEDPKIQQIVGQSPFAGAIQSAMAAHITEHVAYAYRAEVEKRLGVPLPPEGEPLPEDAERELAILVAAAGEKVLADNKAEVADEEAKAAENDPMTQIQLRKLDLDERKQGWRENSDQINMRLKETMAAADALLRKERIASDERREGARIGARIATDADRASKKAVESGVKIGLEMAKELTKNPIGGK